MAVDTEADNKSIGLDPINGGELRRRALAEIGAFPAESIDQLSPQEVQNLVYELQVHQIELEMQNEELRQTQEALELSRARYFELYDLAPVGYLTLSQKGIIREGNLTLAALLETPKKELVEFPLSRHILAADQDSFYHFHRRLRETDDPQVCELRMTRKEGRTFWARLDGVAVQRNEERVYRVIVSDISPHRQAEQIKQTLEEKEILLRELYHRTKNNMLVLSSMLVLQARHCKSEETRAVLTDLQGKVQSMALVHQKLYQSQNLSHVDLGEYIPDLIDLLLKTHQGTQQNISAQVRAAHVFVVLDVAIPCGLVLNELVSNALKHGFPNHAPGEIQVDLAEAENGDVVLTFSDNGVGFPVDFDYRNTQTLGIRTVRAIIEHQLQGTLHFESKAGLQCRMRFATTHYEVRV